MLLVPKACGRRPVVNARCSGSLSVLPVSASAAFDDLSSPSFFEMYSDAGTGATLGAGTTVVMRGPVRLWAPVRTARRVS